MNGCAENVGTLGNMARLHLSAKDLEAVREAFGFHTVEEMQEFLELQQYKHNEREIRASLRTV